jgi:hypothetical protein
VPSHDDSLIDFVSDVSGDEFLKVEEDLGEGFVRLRVSEAERRQAKHDIRCVEDVVVELLRNSRDAHAHRVFVAHAREGDLRTIVVVDDGIGVPPTLRDMIFEPRVTSKLESMSSDRWGVHGRGMALFSIKENVESIRVVASEAHRGMSLEVVSDATALDERSDQSTWPEIEAGEEGSPTVVKGPHNIVRHVLEFACDHPDLDVYLGSPTEILATMHALAQAQTDTTKLVFSDDVAALPVWQRPVAAGDAQALIAYAGAVGLPVSERTAHRVLAGQVPPVESVLDRALDGLRDDDDTQRPDIYRDTRSLKLHHQDVAEFKRDLHGAFDTLAERYYLTLRGEPRVTVGKDEIRVRFPITKED